MAIPQQIELLLQGPNGPMGATLHLPQGHTAHTPLVIWVHGFKGFRHWGHFPHIAEWWAEQGTAVLRLDLSHNGVRQDSPFDISDLEAFGHNTYTKELQDLLTVIQLATTQGSPITAHIMPERVHLVGHSRGGGIALLAANRTHRLASLATWGGIGTLLRFAPEQLAEWRMQGVIWIENSRTGQRLPVYADIFTDWEAHSRDYNLKHAARSLTIPFLQIHGGADTVVTPAEASALHLFNQRAVYLEIPGADHTFGGAHPWTEPELPWATREALAATHAFFNKALSAHL